jgi:DNA-binding winged helix-turn-helix (wHTH) protein/tetratricopeptide (TPR) repeat protein
VVKPADLAGRADFRIGPLLISPPRRRVEGPAGTAQVEPVAMQVFLLLLDAAGKVVTRDDLFEAGWGGAVVGDDSLNRAINRVRRIAAETGPGLFEIETIPRTGYRVTGDILDAGGIDGGQNAGPPRPAVSRRLMLGAAGAAGVAAIAGGGFWSMRRSEADRRFNQLVASAEQALLFDERNRGLRLMRSAVDLRPDDAAALGLLAYTLVGKTGGSENPGETLAADQYAREALKLDPKEPFARLTQLSLQRSMLDLAATEDRLRNILASAPHNVNVMRQLWDLCQSAGLSRRSAELNERGLNLEPLTPATNYPRAQLLWILGRNAEADRVIDRAIELWPDHRWVRFARFMIYAYTDRPRAALAMLDSDKTAPQSFKPEAIALWRISLTAFDQRSSASIAAARAANLDAARRDPSLSSQAILTLASLDETDAAFEVANGLLVYRQAIARAPKSGHVEPTARSTAWRFTPWLFTPPAAAMRADPRFEELCQGTGLTEYWAKRGVTPDYQLGLT